MNQSRLDGSICCFQNSPQSPSDMLIYGKHEFMESYPWIAYPTVLIVFVAAISGTVGNILIITAVVTYKKIRNKESCFVFNLAISDLYVTAIADPMSIIGMYFHGHFGCLMCAYTLCFVDMFLISFYNTIPGWGKYIIMPLPPRPQGGETC